MSKFKVGDKVKRTGGNGCLPIGTITKIIEVRTCGDVKVSYDNEWYDEKYFELVEEYTVKQNTLPKQIFFNDKKKTTVLKWEDGTTTVVHCAKEDTYSKRVGFLEAYCLKTSGMSKREYHEWLNNLIKEDKPMEEDDTPIEISDTEEEMVFSIYKFLKEESEVEEAFVEEAFEFGWPQGCDGKTIKECNKIGYEIEDYWLVPRSQYKPYKEN